MSTAGRMESLTGRKPHADGSLPLRSEGVGGPAQEAPHVRPAPLPPRSSTPRPPRRAPLALPGGGPLRQQLEGGVTPAEAAPRRGGPPTGESLTGRARSGLCARPGTVAEGPLRSAYRLARATKVGCPGHLVAPSPQA